jgi:hypothetical protein
MDGDVRPRLREPKGDGPAEPDPRAGHEGDAPFEGESGHAGS